MAMAVTDYSRVAFFAACFSCHAFGPGATASVPARSGFVSVGDLGFRIRFVNRSFRFVQLALPLLVVTRGSGGSTETGNAPAIVRSGDGWLHRNYDTKTMSSLSNVKAVVPDGCVLPVVPPL